MELSFAVILLTIGGLALSAPQNRIADEEVAELLYKIFGNDGCTEEQSFQIRNCTAQVIDDLEPFANVSFLPDTNELRQGQDLTANVQNSLVDFGSSAKNGSVLGMLSDDADPSLIERSCEAFSTFQQCALEVVGDTQCNPLYYRLMKAAYGVICTEEFKRVLREDGDCLSKASKNPVVEECFDQFNVTLSKDFESDVRTLGLPATICKSIDEGLACLRTPADECGSGVIRVAADLATNMMAAIFGEPARCELNVAQYEVKTASATPLSSLIPTSATTSGSGEVTQSGGSTVSEDPTSSSSSTELSSSTISDLFPTDSSSSAATSDSSTITVTLSRRNTRWSCLGGACVSCQIPGCPVDVGQWRKEENCLAQCGEDQGEWALTSKAISSSSVESTSVDFSSSSSSSSTSTDESSSTDSSTALISTSDSSSSTDQSASSISESTFTAVSGSSTSTVGDDLFSTGSSGTTDDSSATSGGADTTTTGDVTTSSIENESTTSAGEPEDLYATFERVVPEKDCEDSLDDLTQAQKDDPDVWVPRCDDDGSYKDVQCKQIGFCWCVNTDTGAEIEESRIKADMDKSAIIECNDKRYKIEYKTVETIETSRGDDQQDIEELSEDLAGGSAEDHGHGEEGDHSHGEEGDHAHETKDSEKPKEDVKA